jgi:hypothetical protein
MNRRSAVRAAAVLFLACAAPALSAAPARTEAPLVSGMTPFLPPPPEGWQTGGPNVVEDINGVEPFVSAAYLPGEPGLKGLFSVTITHPSPHDLAVAFPTSRPLGRTPWPHGWSPRGSR